MLNSAKVIPIQEAKKLYCVDAPASDAENLVCVCLASLVDIFDSVWDNSARRLQFAKQHFIQSIDPWKILLFMSSKSIAPGEG